MIKKLNNGIFFLIMIFLTVIVLGTIVLFTYFNYKNTISTVNLMMDRVENGNMRKNPNAKPEDEKIDIPLNIDGLYSIIIENSKIISNTDISNDESIQEYAVKVSGKNRENGIIGKYVYKVRKIKENTIVVTLMENEDVILHIKLIFILSIVEGIISVIIIYIISKKLSQIIVNPVKETLEKQKEFISDASHELKTPLAVVEANVDVLENETGSNKWIEYIQNEVESMNKLVNDLLLLAKMENLNNTEENIQFDVSKETEIVVSMFESMAYEKKIKINTNIQEDIYMKGNKEDIQHVLSILIDNAIKHTLSEKDVIVELIKEKNELIFEVKNMGEPIPKEEREKIFERFYRIDKSRNRNEKRYGLGLAIAKTIVQKYNGNIEVSYKNNFTIFKVTIPQ